MVDRAAVEQKTLLVAHELPGKAMQVAQQVQALLHQAAVVEQGLLELLDHQDNQALAVQVVPTPSPDQASLGQEVEAGVRRATKLAG